MGEGSVSSWDKGWEGSSVGWPMGEYGGWSLEGWLGGKVHGSTVGIFFVFFGK